MTVGDAHVEVPLREEAVSRILAGLEDHAVHAGIETLTELRDAAVDVRLPTAHHARVALRLQTHADARCWSAGGGIEDMRGERSLRHRRGIGRPRCRRAASPPA